LIRNISHTSKRVDKTFLDLGIIIVYVLITTLFIILPPLNETLHRPILGFPLVFFVPGYVFVSALFPGDDELDTIERIALSIGLSICIVIFTGFVLNYTPFGIRVAPILFTLSAITLILTAISAVRRLTKKSVH
jgi:uncharacterized membrane protein